MQRVPKDNVLQKVGEISTWKWIQNVQIPSHTIKKNSEDVNASLQQFQDLSLDINELSTQTLVQLQRVANLELVGQEQITGDHILRSQEKEAASRKEIE